MSGLYCQMDVKFMADIKMRRAGPMARALYFQVMAWSRENETDGKVEPEFFTDVAVDIKTPAKHFAKLADVGLMESFGQGGFRIPIDVWTRWNPTKRDLEAKRAKKSDAGSRGAHVKWEHSPTNAHDWCEPCHEAGYLVKRDNDTPEHDDTNMAGAIAGAIANGCQADSTAIAIADTSNLKPQTTTSDSILRDSQTPPVDNTEKMRIVIEQETNKRQRERTGPELRNIERWKASVAKSINDEHGTEIDRMIREYPTAPYDVIAAAAIHGEKHSLQHFQRNEGAA